MLGVQEALETAIGKVANESVEVIAAGRTDASVHASNMIAHFTTHAYRPTHNWLRGVNSLLPDDIALRWIQPMPADFHARFGAIARRYRYITLNQAQRPAILNHQVTHIYEPLDLAAMQRQLPISLVLTILAATVRQPVNPISQYVPSVMPTFSLMVSL